MIDHYKLAPTFLFHPDFESRLFQTQEEVDEAWEEGWFGPSWLVDKTPLLSEMEFKSKAELIQAIRMDPRYKGVAANTRMNLETIGQNLKEFEEKSLLSPTDPPELDYPDEE